MGVDFNNIVTIWDKYMTHLEPLEYLKAYYKEVFGLDATGFTLETKLVDTGIDSMEAFNLLYEMENTYEIRFDKNFTPVTIGEVIKTAKVLIEVRERSSNDDKI